MGSLYTSFQHTPPKLKLILTSPSIVQDALFQRGKISPPLGCRSETYFPWLPMWEPVADWKKTASLTYTITSLRFFSFTAHFEILKHVYSLYNIDQAETLGCGYHHCAFEKNIARQNTSRERESHYLWKTMVVSNIPANDICWQSVIWMSPVPGGISTIR